MPRQDSEHGITPDVESPAFAQQFRFRPELRLPEKAHNCPHNFKVALFVTPASLIVGVGQNLKNGQRLGHHTNPMPKADEIIGEPIPRVFDGLLEFAHFEKRRLFHYHGMTRDEQTTLLFQGYHPPRR